MRAPLHAPSAFERVREHSGLPEAALKTIQQGTLEYTYKGMPCYKDPFDLALYCKLLFEQKPRTVVEIGSAAGGSAVWMADQLRSFQLPSHIFSIDISPPTGVRDPQVTFIAGDVHHLEKTPLPGLLADCPRPLLVVEDGPHSFDGCVAALEFFHPWMVAGEYIIIEDGILLDLGYEGYDNGPNRAVAAFMGLHPGEYVIDYKYCDYYGPNFTWNTNGYLRKR